jgi:hypothetical protein
MNGYRILLLAVPAVVTTTLVASEPLYARGGAPSIMDSPGYQRRLQESRKQLSQPAALPSLVTSQHKSRHGHRPAPLPVGER